MIRGDLPINPSCLTSKKYFVPYQAFNPNQSTQQGAMFVMGGVGNGTSTTNCNAYNASEGWF